MKIFIKNSNTINLIALLFGALLIQNCKKETTKTEVSLPNQGMYAVINDTAWTASIVSASLVYDATNKSKTFSCQGISGDRIIQLVANQNNVSATNNFPLGVATGNAISFFYYIQPIHRELTEQNPTFGSANGTNLVITDIDTTKQLISGTFSFPQIDSAFDANYNFIFSQSNQIKNGYFKQIHYEYSK